MQGKSLNFLKFISKDEKSRCIFQFEFKKKVYFKSAKKEKL
jgi:hypothetical protein